MIYVTAGLRQSISLEILFKALIKTKTLVTLIVVENDLRKFLKDYKIKYQLTATKLKLKDLTINLILLKKGKGPASTVALLHALKIITPNDLLITMPTSKDQLIYKNKMMLGHTELFRNFYKKDLPMVFLGPNMALLLISDHIPLSNVSKITTRTIYQKIAITLENFSKYFYPLKKVVIAGFNPHAGENGLIGKEENKIRKAIFKLKTEFNSIKFLGPLSPDTVLWKNDKKTLLVYLYHDQGLPLFKALNKYQGINLTLGLPFLRMSVDHGTASELYARNCADISGMLFLLKWVKKLKKKKLFSNFRDFL